MTGNGPISCLLACARRRRKVAVAVTALKRLPDFDGQDYEAAPPGVKKFWIGAFFAALCVGHDGPGLLAALVAVETRALSIANWAPVWSGRRLAITRSGGCLFLSGWGC